MGFRNARNGRGSGLRAGADRVLERAIGSGGCDQSSGEELTGVTTIVKDGEDVLEGCNVHAPVMHHRAHRPVPPARVCEVHREPPLPILMLSANELLWRRVTPRDAKTGLLHLKGREARPGWNCHQPTCALGQTDGLLEKS